MATIDRGQDYLYDDFIDNIVEILTLNKSALGLKFIGTTKEWLSPVFPSAYVVFDNAEERWYAMPNVKDIGMTAIIHFYIKNLKANVRKDNIDETLSKIAKVLRQNHSCNGFLDTPQGMTVDRVDAMGELRGEIGGVGDGIIEVTGIKRIRVQNIV